MGDLFWPGSERAGTLLSDLALLEAMTAVEDAWLRSLVDAGLAPATAEASLTDLIGPDDLDGLARGAEASGSPVLGLVTLLRDRLAARPGGTSEAARWVHRGLTSQDVLDTAMVLVLRDGLDEVGRQLRRQVALLTELADRHRATAMVGRTLTQHAVPVTFGLKVTGWLGGVLDAAAAVARVRSALPAQLGGAAGTLAAAAELARGRGADDPATTAWRVARATAAALELTTRPPWHTARGPITAIADALVTCTDAWGHLAADVATLSRPEIGELAEGRGGGSSTMPGKRNPTLSVLVRRAALAGPQLAATVHLAAATAVDERPDGAWHVEWATLRDLGRRTVVAGSQTTDLLGDLQVDEARMAATLAATGVPREQQSMAELVGAASDGDAPAGHYLGASQLFLDATLDRARAFGEQVR